MAEMTAPQVNTSQNAALEAEKQQSNTPDGAERTRDCACFTPRADIYELNDQIIIVADVPGAGEDSIEITLEKNVLTINAYVNFEAPQGYGLALAEYEVGDYQRSFTLSEELDRERIEATVKDGVLRVFLPKAAVAKARKISVKSAR
ncbi:MAG: Hsp20/alpha crystallin family protein [Chloroflexota bacterium]